MLMRITDCIAPQNYTAAIDEDQSWSSLHYAIVDDSATAWRGERIDSITFDEVDAVAFDAFWKRYNK